MENKERKILLLLRESPFYKNYGPNTHVLNYLKVLTQFTSVDVIGFYETEEEFRSWSQLSEFAEELGEIKLFKAKKRPGKLASLMSFFKRELLTMTQYMLPELVELFHKIDFEEYQYIIFDRYYCTNYISDIKDERIKKILIPHDSYSLACQRAQSTVKGLQAKVYWYLRNKIYQNLEKRTKQSFDMILPVSPVDAKHYDQYPGDAIVRDLGIPVPDKTFDIVHEERNEADSLHIIIHGSFFIHPVYLLLVDFFKNIYPKLSSKYSNLKFSVWSPSFGKISPVYDFEKHLNVKVVGYVDDYFEMLNSADIYFYPQDYGSGIQTKLQEAMAIGLPCIAKTETLSPLRVDTSNDGETAFIADSHVQLFERFCSLIDDASLRQSIGKNAKKHIRINYSKEIIEQRLRLLFEDL